MKSISDLKVDLAGALHGTNLNKVQGLDQILYRAAGDLLLDIDPRETKRIAQIDNALYDDVTDYVLPSDLKGTKIVDIRPQVSRALNDNLRARYSKEFDLQKASNTWAIKDNKGVKTLRIEKDTIAGVLLHSCDGLIANGTWAADGLLATNLEADETYYLTGASSLRFDVSSGGYIQNSTFQAVDLSDHEDTSAIFLAIYIPPEATASNLTSVQLRWGSSDSAYWSKSVTAAHDATAFQNGWNILRFDWASASETGSPDSSAVDFLRVTFTTSATIADVRVDSIYSRLPSIWEVEYYSKYLFRTSAGDWQESVTDDSNYINLDTESYNLFFDKIMVLLAPQLQGKDSAFDLEFYRDEYKAKKAKYTSQNPSQAQRPQAIYYRLRGGRRI